MEILGKIRGWASSLADVGVSVAALAIILEVLGIKSVPFVPANWSVVDNVSGMLASLGSQGVMGLIAIWILWAIWHRKDASQYRVIMYEYNAKVLRIVDGDTIDVDIDLGFGVWIHKERIRLEGIDTPESRTRDLEEKKFGLLSKEYVRSLLPVGSGPSLNTCP